MHPDPTFRMADEDAARAFVEQRGFAAIFVATANGPRVVHTPVTWHGEALRFHLSRRNLAAGHLDGADALTVVHGPDAYISPDWYGVPDQVPTWNYAAIEIEGPLAELGADALLGQIERIAEVHEGRLAPKPAWSTAQMDPEKRDAMLREIVCFEQEVRAVRTTAKFSQNKPAEIRARTADALEALGKGEVARQVRPA